MRRIGRDGLAPESAALHLVDSVPLLRPEEQVFTLMLDGWRNRQLARNLAFSTIGSREKAVRAFARHADAFPCHWTAAQVDEWLGGRRAVRKLKRSTLRNYQEAVHSFCAYLIDPAYQWSTECEQRFGTHPVQVVHEWNTAFHVADAEADAGKRAFTRKELIAIFDHAEIAIPHRKATSTSWCRFRNANCDTG
ncbi:hypothetical protein [Saccharopolyspora spinosa]|uniref:Core-binding (CB) domain-containing protein n=1 Tax=Saccharopolyspora spinosa TaxID=60894 RepID=A0A2N3Y1F1_SACSN|nr:hypothetical protein [Saccharopolyspora spinosa]PKW16720.1 hypothetical protein A8926_4592 [Saccharopolyspora spinosa]